MSWRITVAIGSGAQVSTWEVTDQDPPEYGLLDGLSITRVLPEEAPFPAHPEPAQLSMGLVLASAHDARHVLPEAPVSVNYYSPRTAATPLETFDGRITGKPTLSPHGLGVVVRLTATDYLTDLAAVNTWRAGWSTNLQSKGCVTLAFDGAAASAPEAPWSYTWSPTTSEMDSPPGWTHSGLCAPRDASAEGVPMLTALLLILDAFVQGDDGYDWWQEDGTANWGRYVIEPNLTGDGVATPRTLTGWTLRGVFPTPMVRPGRLEPTGPGGLWWVNVPPASTHEAVIDAGHVDWNVDWAYARNVPERVIVTAGRDDGPAGVAQTNAAPRSTMQMESALVGGSYSTFVAEFYLPAGPMPPPWESGAMRWHLHREPDGHPLPDLGELVTVAGIEARWAPLNNREYFPGLVRERVLSIEDGDPYLTLTLTPFGHRTSPGADSDLVWSELDVDGPRWTDLWGGDSWQQLRFASTAAPA